MIIEKEKLLIVDDNRNILKDLENILEFDYEVTTTDKPEEALKLAEKNDYAVILSDFNMPLLSGLGLFKSLEKRENKAIKILMTAQDDIKIAIDAINHNNVFRFILKPFNPLELEKIIRDGLRQYNLLKAEKDILENTLKGSIKMLMELFSIITKPNYTQNKEFRNLAKMIANNMDVKNLWEVEIACLLSKLGYIAIDTDLINKYTMNTNLSPVELIAYQKHVEVSYKLIHNIPRLKNIALSILHQYDRFDGKNIRNSELKGKNIPIISRILYLINDYARFSIQEKNSITALRRLNTQKGRYDPQAFGLLIKYTVGNLELPKENKFTIIIDNDDFITNKNIMWYKLNELKDGMILAEDIKDTKTGLNLVGKGTTLNDSIISYLESKISSHKIQEAIKIVKKD